MVRQASGTGTMGTTRGAIERREFGGLPLYVRPGTPDEVVAASCLGDEFARVCELLGAAARPNTVLDLGGYIGAAAIRFATAIPHCTVITVEPSPENFRVLQLNVLRHANIVAVNAAVGPERGRLALYARHTGEWGHTMVAEPRDCPEPTRIGVVDVVTVGDLLERHSPRGNAPSLAKIDIEGSEAELLGADPRLDDFAIVTAELHDRIREGCTEAWEKALDRRRLELSDVGEKRTSIDPDLLRALLEARPAPARRSWIPGFLRGPMAGTDAGA